MKFFQIYHQVVSTAAKRGRIMFRKLTLLAVFVFLTTRIAYGVGLGELQLNSALNQSFNAEIVLSNDEGLEIEEILPNLASQEDFDRVGVERTDVLTDLRFAVQRGDSGEMKIIISSRRPVIEPYLNFLVEVLWPNGRLLREYTVLLDPPVFGEDGIEQIDVTQTAVTSRAQQQGTAQAGGQRSAATSGGMSGMGAGEIGMTGTGDTLWSIAASVRPDNSDVSVQQVMLAIQRANPEAFIENNINLLKAGHVLRLPDMAALEEETFTAALQEVSSQNEAWEDYKAGEGRVSQLDASSRQSATADNVAAEDDGELKLLSASSQEGQRAGGGPENSARVVELENDVAVAMEDLDRTRRANTDLNIRLDDLAGQIETLNQLVQLKDDQLAELQNQLKKVQALAAQTALAEPDEAVVQESPSLLSNPLLLGGLAIVILGLAGGLFLRRRKSGAADDDMEDELDELDMEIDDATSVMAVSDDESDAEGTGSVEAADESDDEDISPQTSDVISEADIYIAYGRFPQAITFLENAIEAEPERVDIQLKLLEVFVQTEDKNEFNLLLEKLKTLGNADAISKAEALQASLPGAAEEAAAAMGATVISTEPIAAIEEPADDDLSFDLDDLDSETDDDELDLDGLDLDDDDAMDLDIEDSELETDEITDLDLGLDAEVSEDGEDTPDLDELGLDLDSDDLGDTAILEPDSEADLGDGLELDAADLDLDDSDLELDDIELDLDTDDDAISLEDESVDEELQLDDTSLDTDSDLSLDDDDLDLDADFSLDDTAETATDDDLALDDDLDLDDDLNLDDDLIWMMT